MIEELIQRPVWVWLILACIFLAIEVLITPGGFFLSLGLAAGLTAIAAYLIPGLSWQGAATLFAALMVTALIIWWRLLKKRRAARQDPAAELNARDRALIGYQAVLKEPVEGGRGRIKIQDAPWPIEAEEDYPAGTRVEVTAVKGITLKVKAVP